MTSKIIQHVVQRTKRGHIKQHEVVTVSSFKGKIVKAFYDPDTKELAGYTVNLDGWWVYVPAYLVENNVQQ